ncbi:TrbI/VirB10 family protein [Niveispirillum cyanobacteriorum]|uniref:Type VI secretion protein n=1 Tax=Niveispirillum cyanobacteriorum TaxID=1612173 RepID=A0A2K9NHK8_9PROT|nr:TrbI/VirB10 family protein [Niveispirillum cyanobacteriorum]AUN32563.1 type VI secretion protein [Niveispirillum cyanobacteriorum]
MSFTADTVRVSDDPRLSMSAGALVLAGRTHYPVVAARHSGGNLGMAAGVACILALGGLTFWGLNQARQPIAETAPLPAPPVPPPAPVAALPVPTPAPVPAAVTPAPVPARTPDPQRLAAPVMVFDMSVPAPATAPTAGPTAPVNPAAPNAPAALSENEAFAMRVGNGGVDTASAVHAITPATTVAQGALIPAVLETAIDSDLPGYVRALVSQDVRSFDGSRVLVPRTSRLIGQYKSGLQAGQKRVYVLWTRLIRPDGVSVALASPAISHDGKSGLSGDVDTHFVERFGSATMLSVVGALSAIGNAALILSGSQSAAGVAAQRDSQIPPTIRVDQGEPIRVFVARDLDFSLVANGGGRS